MIWRKFGQVVVFHRVARSVRRIAAFFCILRHARVGLTVQVAVKVLAKSLGSFFHFLFDLVVDLVQSPLRSAHRRGSVFWSPVVDQRIVECVHVTGGFPGFGVHENGRIKAHDIFVHLHHRFPPIG